MKNAPAPTVHAIIAASKAMAVFVVMVLSQSARPLRRSGHCDVLGGRTVAPGVDSLRSMNGEGRERAGPLKPGDPAQGPACRWSVSRRQNTGVELVAPHSARRA